MKRRLVETLEANFVAGPTYNQSGFDNLTTVWNNRPYGELAVVLAHLRALAMIHQTNHWIASGDASYSDHQLFQHLYESTLEEIDEVAERAVGLSGPDCVDLMLQVRQLESFINDMCDASQDVEPHTSYSAEMCILMCLKSASDSLREKGQLTRGLDNLLQGIEDKHEQNVYLLKQRLFKAPR